MSALTQAIYDRLSGDPTLQGLLAIYGGAPAIFTTDPAPGDAELPYLVSAGEVSTAPFDTKTTLGREVRRDVRCYADTNGSAALIEEIAEQVRSLLHRHELAINGFETWVAECTGPIVADEDRAYGRVVSIRLILMEVEAMS